MKIECPHCHATLKAPDELEGKNAKCPKCKKSFVITSLGESQSKLPAESHSGQAIRPLGATSKTSEPQTKEGAFVAIYSCGKINCPSCNKSMQGRIEMIGDVGMCPKCNTEFIIGSLLSAQPSETQTRTHALKFMKEIKPVSSWEVGSFAILLLMQPLGIFSAFLLGSADLVLDFMLVSCVAGIVELFLLYRIWSITYRLGVSRTSPWIVIIGLFVPIVNFYFIFKSFWGWCRSYNKALKKLDIDLAEHSMPSSIGFLASLMPFVVTFIFLQSLFISRGHPKTLLRRMTIQPS